MAILDEIKYAKDIGYKGTGRYIWHSCIDCGKERWVRYVYEKPKKLKCFPCSRTGKTHKNRMPRIQNKLRNNLSGVIHGSIRDRASNRHWEDLVGYTLLDLMRHLEEQFQKGMNWDNYGKWHIDHIIPIKAFNFLSYGDIDFRRCWALRNLQPLWGHDNMVKSAKVSHPIQRGLAISV